jgi:hypothetical protein
MKATILLTVLIVAMGAFLTAQSARAGARESDTTPSLTIAYLPQSREPSFKVFWTKFKTAVISGDKNLVATMSQFPIEMSYGIAPIRNRTEFIRRYREIFSDQADAQKCFAKAKPVVERHNPNRFTVGCEDAAGNEVVVYAFMRTRTGWKFKSLDNINE